MASVLSLSFRADTQASLLSRIAADQGRIDWEPRGSYRKVWFLRAECEAVNQVINAPVTLYRIAFASDSLSNPYFIFYLFYNIYTGSKVSY